MARTKIRSRQQVVKRVGELSAAVTAGLFALRTDPDDPRVVDALWQAEGLGTLLWALGLVEEEPFDQPYEPEWLVATPLDGAGLRPRAEIERARETARLWHWRVRTHTLKDVPEIQVPEPWQSFDQLVATVAMRAHEQELIPPPLRGDFPAFGIGYRELSDEQQTEIRSIAFERHRALNWLCGEGATWADTPTDT